MALPSRTSSPAIDGERAKQERRRQIISAATLVFAEAGYHGASINAIIERAAIARGTFYLYFESKAAVFDSILDEAMTALRKRIHRIDVETPGVPPPQVQLRAQLVSTLEWLIGDRALAGLLLQVGHTPEAEAANRLEKFYGEIRDLIGRALESGVALGVVRPCNRVLVSAALLGAVRGMIEYVITAPANATPTVDEVVAELIAVGLRSVLP